MDDVFGATLPTWLPSAFVMLLPRPSPITLKVTKNLGFVLDGLTQHIGSGRRGVFCDQAIDESDGVARLNAGSLGGCPHLRHGPSSAPPYYWLR